MLMPDQHSGSEQGLAIFLRQTLLLLTGALDKDEGFVKAHFIWAVRERRFFCHVV
jgi:hypothetical protein